MNKRQFTECVDDLYTERNRLVEHAEQIICMELEKHGEMDMQFLFDVNEKDNDFERVWLNDGKWLTSIKRDANTNVIIGYDSNWGGEGEVHLIDLEPDERIEIAYFLCRR